MQIDRDNQFIFETTEAIFNYFIYSAVDRKNSQMKIGLMLERMTALKLNDAGTKLQITDDIMLWHHSRNIM